MDKESQLLSYIQDMYRYCTIAAATAIVMSTIDKQQCVEEYLSHLQRSLPSVNVARASSSQHDVQETRCSNINICNILQDVVSQTVSIDSGYNDSQIVNSEVNIVQQQSQLNTTNTLLDPPAVVSIVSATDSIGNDEVTDVVEDLIIDMDCGEECAQQSSDEQKNVRETAVENARFIYSLVCLRFAANNKPFVAASAVSEYLKMANTDVAKELSSSLLGGDSEASTSSDMNIASTFIQYHTKHTREHVLQSLNTAVTSLGTLLLDKRPHIVRQCFNSWENSSEHYVVDSVCSALDMLRDEDGDVTEYTAPCIQLVKSFLEKLMDADEDEFVMWEQQCGMILKLLTHVQVCEHVMNLLIENIQHLADNITSNANLDFPEYVNNIHISSSNQTRSYYVFYLLEQLLAEYKNIHNDIVKKHSVSVVQDADALDALWRNSYTCGGDDDSRLKQSRQLISKWNSSLAQCAITFTNHNAYLLSMNTWSCINLVKDLNQ